MQQPMQGNWQVDGVVVSVQTVMRPGRWLWLQPAVTLMFLGAAVFLASPHLEAVVTWLATALGTVLGGALAAALVLTVFRMRLPWWAGRSLARLLFRPLALLGGLALWLLGGLRVRRSLRRTVQVVRVVSARGLDRTVFVPCDGVGCALTPGDEVTVRGWFWRGVCHALAVRNGRSGQRWGLIL
ncbi:hypothetical protein [Deinococcus marmoris]|uniref:hypothetical protein n=1 Tax=Deinococcus marmoris TaxID=249408 RepID=UPI000497E1C4|nr:hypothetical protein [Deinococcus marmoris]